MSKSLNILVLNHRCLRHPEAGGAEVSLFEQARRWITMGHEVTVLCEDPGRDHAPAGDELFEGITIKRRGNAYTIYLYVALYLLFHGRKHDVVLDVWNGVPFLSSRLTRTPHVLLVNHVCGAQWRAEFPFPLSLVGMFFERYVVRHLYPSCPIVTISPTTRDELIHLGFQDVRIEIVYCGVESAGDISPAQFDPKSQRIVYVGRVRRYKRIRHLVELFAQVKRVCPNVHLDIVGKGNDLDEVRSTVAALQLDDCVTLHGYVSERTKAQLLTAATVFATPSLVEGWGICVIEANAYGCPAVAYDVPGLSNSIRHNETGILAANDAEFVEGLTALLQDTKRRESLSHQARAWARHFSWDEAAAGTLAHLVAAAMPTESGNKKEIGPTSSGSASCSTVSNSVNVRRGKRLSAELIMVAGFGATSVINYVFALSMGWLLRPGDYGLLAFSQTVILLGALILNSGVVWSLTSTLARTTPEKHAAHIRGAYLGNLGLSLIVSLIIGILFATGSITQGLEDWRIVLIVVSAMPFLAAVAVANAAFRGRQQFAELAFNQVLEIVIKATVGTVLVLTGLGVIGAVLGFMVGALVSSTLSGWRTMRTLGEPLIGPTVLPNLKATTDMFGALLGIAIILNLDVIMLKLLAADRDLTGIYQAATVLANTPYYLTTALLAVLFANLARDQNSVRSDGDVAKMVRIILIYILPLELVLAAVPKSILLIVFPQSYGEAASVLPLLAAGNGALLLLTTLATTFQATGKARLSAKILLITTTFEFIALVVFIPSGGPVAAALVFSAACFSALVLHAVIYIRQVTGVHYKRLVSWALRYAVCLLIAALSVLSLLRFTNSLWIVVSVSSLCYLAALVSVGLRNISRPYVPLVVLLSILEIKIGAHFAFGL